MEELQLEGVGVTPFPQCMVFPLAPSKSANCWIRLLPIHGMTATPPSLNMTQCSRTSLRRWREQNLVCWNNVLHLLMLYPPVLVCFMMISGTFFPILCIIIIFFSSECCTGNIEHIFNLWFLIVSTAPQFPEGNPTGCVIGEQNLWSLKLCMHFKKKPSLKSKGCIVPHVSHCPPCSEIQFLNQGGDWFKVQIESKVLKLLKSLAVCQPQPWCFKGLIHPMDILCWTIHYEFCCSVLLIKPSGLSPSVCLLKKGKKKKNPIFPVKSFFGTGNTGSNFSLSAGKP